MAKDNAAQKLFKTFFFGPNTHTDWRPRKKHVRHQGVQECTRRVCQREMGICGL